MIMKSAIIQEPLCKVWLLLDEPKKISNSTRATINQRYTYRVLQTIQMKLILSWVWAEWAVLGRAKTALKFKYEI